MYILKRIYRLPFFSLVIVHHGFSKQEFGNHLPGIKQQALSKRAHRFIYLEIVPSFESFKDFHDVFADHLWDHKIPEIVLDMEHC